MNKRATSRLLPLLVLAMPSTGAAQGPYAPRPGAPRLPPAAAAARGGAYGPGPTDDGPPLPPTSEELAAKVEALETRLDQTEQMFVRRRPTLTVGGYADFGFFWPQGSGVGVVRDNGNVLFPEYRNQFGWVFLGDLLAPTVNTRGEAADLGELPGAMRFDSVNARGAAGFILNEVNLTLGFALAENVLGTASVNFVPRTGRDFALGDFIDVDLAQVEWLPFADRKTSIFVGKMDPVIGIEYRERKAPNRFGITPSLLARYTVGPALGLKIRSKFGPSDNVVIAAALTNGSNTTEQFHFYDEIDSNDSKTGSARLSLRPPGLPDGVDFEVGGSGQYGAQDRATNNREAMWFWGIDVLAHFYRVDVKAQFLRGKAPGWPEEDVYGLDLRNGGYVEVNWLVTSVLGLYGRGEFRDAFVWLGDRTAPDGANRAYLTKSWRATAGLRLAFTERIILKAEYLHNGEYGGLPSIANDVFTSSLVFTN